MSPRRGGYHRRRRRDERMEHFGAFLRQLRTERGLRQEDLRRLTGLSQTAISRLERGEYLPSRESTEDLSDALRLKPEDRLKLFELAGWAVTQTPQSPDEADSTSQVSIDMAFGLVLDLREAVLGGKLPFAWGLSGILYKRFREDIDRRGGHSQKANDALSRALAEVITETVGGYKVADPIHKAENRAQPLLEELDAIATQTQDREIYGLVCLNKANIAYLKKDFPTAIGWYTKALESMDDPNKQLWFIRDLVISYAHLGDEAAVLNYSKQARKLIEAGRSSQDQVSATLEGLGRGWGLLGKADRALRHFERAEAVDLALGKKHKLMLPTVQRARSALEALEAGGVTDKTYIETVTQSGIAVAKSAGFLRYVPGLEAAAARLL